MFWVFIPLLPNLRSGTTHCPYSSSSSALSGFSPAELSWYLQFCTVLAGLSSFVPISQLNGTGQLQNMHLFHEVPWATQSRKHLLDMLKAYSKEQSASQIQWPVVLSPPTQNAGCKSLKGRGSGDWQNHPKDHSGDAWLKHSQHVLATVCSCFTPCLATPTFKFLGFGFDNSSPNALSSPCLSLSLPWEVCLVEHRLQKIRVLWVSNMRLQQETTLINISPSKLNSEWTSDTSHPYFPWLGKNFSWRRHEYDRVLIFRDPTLVI